MEPISSAASIVTVATLLLQLCDCLRKVREVWQSIKEAPNDIDHMCTEVDLFITWLTIIASNYRRHSSGNNLASDTAVIKTLEYCLRTVLAIRNRSHKLKEDIARKRYSRRWASVKAVLQKKRTAAMLQDLERLKSLMILVQKWYTGCIYLVADEILRLMTEIASRNLQDHRLDRFTLVPPSTDVDNSHETRSRTILSYEQHDSREPKRILKTSERCFSFGLAALKYRLTNLELSHFDFVSDAQSLDCREQRIQYDLKPASWLLLRGFRLQCDSIFGNWQYKFQTFRYVSENALIIDFCKAGDVSNIQKMFAQGMASLYDRVSLEREDWTLLHVSCALLKKTNRLTYGPLSVRCCILSAFPM